MDPAQSDYVPKIPQKSFGEQAYSYIAKWYILLPIAALMILNLLVLNVLFFLKPASKNVAQALPQVQIESQQNKPSECSSLCRDEINKATQAVKLEFEKLLISISPSPGISKSPTLIPTQTPTPTTQKREFFIPLGSGSGSATDWTTLDTIGATIDTSEYGNITNAIFEASVRIPTGNQTAYLRLLNGSTYQTVVGSEVNLTGGTPAILISSPLTLSKGSASYYVQIKTQLGYTTYIDFARIRIDTN